MAGPGGRPKGMPNKIGAGVKVNVVAVFDRIGGREEMAEWAKANRTEFYKLYARLIPTESTTEVTFRDARDLSDAELLAIATASSAGAARQTTGESELSEVH